MTTRPPPPRYRVVEQGRRLVVIDTQTGAPAARRTDRTVDPAPDSTRRTTAFSTGLTRTDFAGSATLTTHPLYDDKAPRRLTLDPGAAQIADGVRVCLIGGALMFAVAVIFFPWLFVLPVMLLNPKPRAAIRARITAWLDRYDADTSTG